MLTPLALGPEADPLSTNSPAVFDQLIEAVGPASLIVVIAARMSDGLKQRVTPEDVWQETLLHAWRDRARCVWQGLASFRRWLLEIAHNRILDLADREAAHKRGGAFPDARPSVDSTPVPLVTTTPSRIAIAREQARAMQAALDELQGDVREVVRLRLFEDLTMLEVAAHLGIGVEGARHRFRRGAEAYRQSLKQKLALSDTASSSEEKVRR